MKYHRIFGNGRTVTKMYRNRGATKRWGSWSYRNRVSARWVGPIVIVKTRA